MSRSCTSRCRGRGACPFRPHTLRMARRAPSRLLCNPEHIRGDDKPEADPVQLGVVLSAQEGHDPYSVNVIHVVALTAAPTIPRGSTHEGLTRHGRAPRAKISSLAVFKSRVS